MQSHVNIIPKGLIETPKKHQSIALAK